eukprot:CAMPEP_0185733244 /NCGR_PEP_ID=MMETSP1171-20130828/18914_1 /TAXON_ID=374046 /ORGANISM="Helicotheca tamensis, Strain CCMP826" /LENGTH=151 /DNA_ID=CAMNT_0028402919 /DNA_START=126 /DNA_END=578 /DNA_ORIENTATION=-
MVSDIWDRFGFGKEETSILMVGLDAAGKTTILYKLRLGECITTIPTIGFNVETVNYKNVTFTIWDVGGQERIRKLWDYYYRDAEAIIFVVDSNDVDRIDLAAEEFNRVIGSEHLLGASVLVFANKQDLPNALAAHEIGNRMRLGSLKGREW